jgi:hypothetical protein
MTDQKAAEHSDTPSRSIHDAMVDRMYAEGALAPRDPTAILSVEVNDPPALVASWVRDRAGREVGFGATWLRFVRADLGRGLLFLLHNPHQGGEAELVVVAEPGTLTRNVIRHACSWAFLRLQLPRVVVRFPASRTDLADLARRGGFHHEGTARRFFNGTEDASVWAMLGTECRWLPRSASPAPATDTPPHSSLRMH